MMVRSESVHNDPAIVQALRAWRTSGGVVRSLAWALSLLSPLLLLLLLLPLAVGLQRLQQSSRRPPRHDKPKRSDLFNDSRPDHHLTTTRVRTPQTALSLKVSQAVSRQPRRLNPNVLVDQR